jgi:hypothetical protein
MRYWNIISKYREERRSERHELKSGGFTRPFTTRFKGVALVTATILVVIVFLLVAAMTDLFGGEPRADVMSAGVAAIVGVGVLITGLQQWRAARDEITLDKFYERLETSNKLLDSWQEARAFVSLVPREKDVEPERYYRRVMYVYRELDNLEYGLAKYRIGNMSAENAYRCLRTFRARCLSEEFRNLATECVRCEPGYNKETIGVVSKAEVWARNHKREIVIDSPAAS